MRRRDRRMLSCWRHAWVAALLLAGSATAEQLTSEASDPTRLGWMQGFPPSADKLITQPDANYFSFPKLRWSVCRLREFLPTEAVSRGLGAPIPLEYALDDQIDDVSFTLIGSDRTMTWRESIDANYSDGLLIIHDGKVVYERYLGCLNETGKHAAMSMTKSLVGLLAEILVVEGVLDEAATVASIVPELASSAFGSATVRQVMDMTTGVAYSEDYADPNADIWRYAAAASPLPKPEGYVGPNGYFEYLQTVQPQGGHGQAFGYKTINTDVLGWLISRVTGLAVTDLLSTRIWRRMGAEQDAYMTVDAIGTPFAGGGLSAGLRDLGRVGLLMLNEGELNGERVFPAEVVERIRTGGDKKQFAKAGFTTLEGGSYRSMWWLLHNDHAAYAARGVHGQTIYVDPTANMVLVRFASFPVAKNAHIDPTSLPAYEAVAKHLLASAGSDLAGEWQIEAIAGVERVDAATTEFVVSPSGRLAASVGCNRFGGDVELQGNRFEVGNTMTTLMACPDEIAQLEQHMTRALQAVRAYRLMEDAPTLELLDAEGDVLVKLSRRE